MRAAIRLVWTTWRRAIRRRGTAGPRTGGRPEQGRKRPPRALVVALAGALALVTPAAAAAATPQGASAGGPGQQGFTDIAKNWAQADITELVRSGVITVPKSRLFQPSVPVTRLDFALWMARGEELTPPAPGSAAATPPFKDWSQVPSPDRPMIAAAVQAGLLHGYPGGLLRPLQPITRLEMAVVIGRVLEGLGERPDTNYFNAFVDGGKIPAWGAPAALPLQDEIMYGEPASPEAAIAPDRPTTRAETAALVLRFLQYRAAHYHTAPLPAPPRIAAFLIGAWDSNTNLAYQVLQRHGKELNWLVFTGYSAGPDGTLRGYDSPRTLAWVRAHPMPLLVMVQNDWPNDAFLHNPTAEHRFLTQLMAVLERSNYAGVNIDFEGIAPADRAAFTDFIAMLAGPLHARHFLLTVDTPSETATDTTAKWAAAYDYPALAHYVDYLVLMAYDYHYAGGAPGPVGPLDWIRQVLAYTTSILPPKRVVLGLPAYGYLWGSNGKDAAYWVEGMQNEASAHGAFIAQNPAAEEGTFTYTTAGVHYVGWFVDAQGLAARLRLAREMGLGGVIFWRLDYNAPSWWPVLAVH